MIILQKHIHSVTNSPMEVCLRRTRRRTILRDRLNNSDTPEVEDIIEFSPPRDTEPATMDVSIQWSQDGEQCALIIDEVLRYFYQKKRALSQHSVSPKLDGPAFHFSGPMLLLLAFGQNDHHNLRLDAAIEDVKNEDGEHARLMQAPREWARYTTL